MKSKQKQAPRNISIFDLVRYRLPWAGKASILHRISGALLFLALPLILMVFEHSLARPTPASSDSLAALLSHPLFKAVSLVFI